MPLVLRERIEKAIQKMVPPRDYVEAHRLARLGAVAAPILAKSLLSERPESRILILIALGSIDYDPSLPAIARCSTDKHTVELRITVMKRTVNASVNIGAYALNLLLLKATKSEMAKTLFKESLAKLPKKERELFLKSMYFNAEARLVLKELKVAPAGTSRSSHVESTG